MPPVEATWLVFYRRKGNRSGFQTYYFLLLQWLSFEIFHLMSLPVIFKHFDASVCYDIIIKAIYDIHTWFVVSTKNTMSTSCLIKCNTRHCAKTAHGVSTDYLCGDLHTGQEAEVKGIVNSGDNWNLVLSMMIQTLKKSVGLYLCRVDGTFQYTMEIYGYINDSNYVITYHHSGDPDEYPLFKQN